MAILGLIVVVLVALGVVTWRVVASLSGEQKVAIKDAINNVFIRAEVRGLFPKAPAFESHYHAHYPSFRLLEDNHKIIRDECVKLLGIKEKLTDMEAMGGGYTAGGIHTARWKTFMFKSGSFIEENCRLAPKTTELLRQIPNVYTIFFSVLDPHQHIPPHFGYYKGFLRYHLGVIIPQDNVDRRCWLRINADLADNRLRDKSLIDRGETYYWKEGAGVMFDDTFLHDAANESDEVRVVMWMDVARRMPWYLHLFNKLVLFVIHQEGSVKRIRKNAKIAL